MKRFALFAALLAARCVAQLPRLNISNDISISGISSGADFAAQFQVAYSDIIVGSGIFAGQPFSCAVQRFVGEDLWTCDEQPPTAEGPGCVGFPDRAPCIGCGVGQTLRYDHCKQPAIPEGPAYVDVGVLGELTTAYAAAGAVAPTSNLANARVYLYRGTLDTVYLDGAVNKTRDYFVQFSSNASSNIYFEASIPSVHCQPTSDPWLPASTCDGKTREPPAVCNCGFDGAGAALQWIYRNQLTPPSSMVPNVEYVQPFDQTVYFGSVWPGMGSDGFAYIPPACSSGASCRLHIAFHGCGMSYASPTMNISFVQHTGYLPWALANNIIVLFPQGGGYIERNVTAPSAQMGGGCWDGYGQTGWDYALRTGPQMIAIRNMIQAIAGF
jgi:hypothetical protein